MYNLETKNQEEERKKKSLANPVESRTWGRKDMEKKSKEQKNKVAENNLNIAVFMIISISALNALVLNHVVLWDSKRSHMLCEFPWWLGGKVSVCWQETQVPSLIWEDSVCWGATKPLCPNHWADALEPSCNSGGWCALELMLHKKRSNGKAAGE